MMSGKNKNVKDFVKYWYTRYLLATELYMAEPWEKAVIQSLFAVAFLALLYINHWLVVTPTAALV